jgi:hypothetical protein
MAIMRVHCKDCEYWETTEQDNGVCHWFPPVSGAVPMEMIAKAEDRPVVQGTDMPLVLPGRMPMERFTVVRTTQIQVVRAPVETFAEWWCPSGKLNARAQAREYHEELRVKIVADGGTDPGELSGEADADEEQG